MSALSEQVTAYLRVRRAMGYKLERHEKLLGQFLEYLNQRGEEALTVDNMLDWATAPDQGSSRWWALRLSVVRGLAIHLHAIDPIHQIPPPGILPIHEPRPAPYLYCDEEVAALVRAAGRLGGPPLRALTYQTLIRILAVTGMRVGEAIALDRDDFDERAGTLTVRDTKFGKSRLLPLHTTTVTGLRDYLNQRDTFQPHPRSTALLVTPTGSRLRYTGGVWDTFNLLRDDAGLGQRTGNRKPRIHDLRHTFAVATLLDWYRDGLDVAAMLPRLSTYLGHADPKHTYWYLTAAPELLALACDRLETKGARS
jgi:integrase/recombinase XerD